MKSSMIVRPVDSNGRVVLPKHLLYSIFNANDKEKLSVEISYNEDSIILKKYKPSCVFCDNKDNLTEFNGLLICPLCIKNIKNL